MHAATELFTPLEPRSDDDRDHSEEYQLDCSKVCRILLRDNVWHYVYKPTEQDRQELTKTLAHVRRKCDALCKGKTDAEVVEAMPGYFPGRQHPLRLAAKPFRMVLIEGERWAVWPEGQDPIPGLQEILCPWSQIMALEVA